MLLLAERCGSLGRSMLLMWIYEKRLQYPVRITKTCPKTAQLIISQYGGPDGELSASMRYLSQRYTMPLKTVGGLLTDIGTEELAHMEKLWKKQKRSWMKRIIIFSIRNLIRK